MMLWKTSFLIKKFVKKFNNINSIDSIIARRRLISLTRLIRMPCKNLPTRLISDFCKKKRSPGRSNYTLRNSLINDIRKMIPSVKDDGSFILWAHIANNELVWSILINNIDRNDPQPSDYNPEWDGNTPEPKSTPKPPPSFS